VTPGLIPVAVQRACRGPAAPGRVGADKSGIRKKREGTTGAAAPAIGFFIFTLGAWHGLCGRLRIVLSGSSTATFSDTCRSYPP